MTAPQQELNGTELLAGEWARISRLIIMVEALRTGDVLPDDFPEGFEATAQMVVRAREQGAWSALSRFVDGDSMGELDGLDIDLLALALVPEAVPALAPRLQALQPHLASPYPSLALVQELLIMDSASDVDKLLARLSPDAPLIAHRLMQVEGEGVYQRLRPGPGIALAILGRALDVGPPPGAHLVHRKATWDDLVVSAQTLRALREYVAWIKYREKVFRDWGARPIGGPLALFSGPSGVGKTYAATAIATELGWPLYTLDLGRIMSKYVGETEKNLNRLLDALHGRLAVLQVDEADALLGKRGEISDARDRYANLEVSHLLSRLEQHLGPVILTTNMRNNIDAAFLRRFQVVVDFSGPDADARARLWRLLLPPRAPLAEDVDPAALAEAINLSGGSIHNAAVHAAMLAVDEGAAISYRHIARSVWRELSKDNRQIRRSEIGFLAGHLETEDAA